MKEISVIIPVYNDFEVIPALYDRLSQVLIALNLSYEILFVDDGSKDNSIKALLELQGRDQNIKIIEFKRNYGQEEAIAAGLDYSHGSLIVVMDSDLQDRPEDIPAMLKLMTNTGTLMVIARRKGNHSPALRKLIRKIFFLICNTCTMISHDPDLGVFRVIDRKALEQVYQSNIRSGTRLSLFYLYGTEYRIIDLPREQRYAGKSSYNFFKLSRLAWKRFFFNLSFMKKKATGLRENPHYVIKRITGGGDDL